MEAMDDIIEIDDDRFSEGSESLSDNSDEDPSYTALDEMSSKLSQLSVTKKSKRCVVEETEDVVEVDEAEELGEVEEKSFEEVQRIVGDGKIEKLKVEQCKVYLRKNRLRLTGNKATLIERIKEHLYISNGGGEKKYPISSFVMNCKGDACTGDVVLFEQNVYDMFNIASRSATGPPCGTRMVAGRIVKESYGAAKQQHTFTVEVLWSKGEKPLPPLHPLLIKGRNLYRLKTMRQKWEDEDERRKKLMEKHARGSLARSNREARIEEKEKRKTLRENRVSRWEPNKSQPKFESTLVPKPSLQPQRSSSSDNSRNTENQAIGPWQSEIPSKPAITAHHTSLATNYGQPTTKHEPHQKPGLYIYHDKVTEECQSKKDSVQYKYIDQASQSFVGYRSFSNGHINQPPYPHYKESYYNPGGHIDQTTKFDQRPFTGTNNYHPTSPPRGQHPYGPSRRHYDNYCPTNPSWSQYGDNNYRPTNPSRRHYSDNNFRPMSPSRGYYSNNNYRPASPSRRQYFVQQKPCHYYARGRCHYGESCKYSHDALE